MNLEKYRLKPENLSPSFKKGLLKCNSTKDVCICKTIIGQERAVEAIKVGLGLKSVGYNIFITGLSGTGRMTTVKTFLENIDSHLEIPDDLCYVYNFKNPDSPTLLRLPPSKGNLFKKRLQGFFTYFISKLPDLVESIELVKKFDRIIEKYKSLINKLYAKMNEEIEKSGFKMVEVTAPNGKVFENILPVIDGKPEEFENLENLTDEGKFDPKRLKKIKRDYNRLYQKIKKIDKKIEEYQKKQGEELNTALKDTISPVIEEKFKEILSEFGGNKKVVDYLNDVKKDILSNLNTFKRIAGISSPEENTGNLLLKNIITGEFQREFLKRYDVNVIVDNTNLKKPPVIIERFPNYKNLFGAIEKSFTKGGVIVTDFTKIKAGSFLKANGGYLILNASDVLIEPEVWKTLKRALKYRKITIQNLDSILSLNTTYLNPEPIDVDLKVVLIGDVDIYNILYNYDDEFKKIFKILADFDTQMDATEENIEALVSLLNKIITEEKLLHLDRDAIEEILKFGMRLAGRKDKITTRFSEVADILRESTYWAKLEGKKIVDGETIKKAIERKNNRNGKIRDKINELIEKNVILIDTEGEKVGQINGLSVYDFGYFSFGVPTKITAQVSLGKDGVINIEREAGMSGKVHDKGILILTSFLRSRFTKDFPLSVNVSICFEQSYTGVDGDSASSTEIYSILSALSGIPIKQYIAVTGSVNQKGEIQPIGGVNEKIEGFFEICKRRGLTGKEGVIIPEENVMDLILKDEVINAIRNRKFHIYAISHVDEGIEILTGVKAGKPKKDGTFTEGSINQLVLEKLKEFSEKYRSFENE